MPFYDYECRDCGLFQLFRSLQERNVAAYCPFCHAEAHRLIAAPNLSLMSSGRRTAFAKNEKSRHSPEVATRHRCGSGCGCGSSKIPRSKSTRSIDLGKAGRFESPKKKKRPWMLGH